MTLDEMTDDAIDGLKVSDMGHTAFTRMAQNLRPTQTK